MRGAGGRTGHSKGGIKNGHGGSNASAIGIERQKKRSEGGKCSPHKVDDNVGDSVDDSVGDKVQVHDNFTTSSHQSGGVFVGYCIGLTSNTPSFFLFFSQALAVFDKQLSTLEEQVALGDVRTYVGRVESALLYLWNEEPTGRAIPVAVQRALPDLGDRFVLAHCLDCAFLLEEENRGRSRPPMDPNGFYRCITEVVLQGATLKAALVLPSE